ncbi:hypothetical protein A9W99_10955 [Mycobacterium sp. 1164966.3]|nr:hypothetical protein A9W99_10955 [Mycobacterium sp. 1164966.3]
MLALQTSDLRGSRFGLRCGLAGVAGTARYALTPFERGALPFLMPLPSSNHGERHANAIRWGDPT